MPDLSELFRSQPGWVVVSVILIIAAAYVLRPVLAGRFGQDDDDEAEQVADGAHAAASAARGAPTGGPGRTYDAIADALDRVYEVAEREGAGREQAEQERDRIAARLTRALADLADCERAAAGPVRDAHRYVGRRRRAEPDTDPRIRRPPRPDHPAR